MLLIVGEAIVVYQRDVGPAGADTPYAGPWPSGAPAIAAYVAARLGVPTAFVGGVGRDAHGQVMRDGLGAAGVDLGHLVEVADAPTATARITYRGEGHREFDFAVAGTAATRVTEADLGDLPERAAWLHMSGSALIFGEPLAATALAALRRAHRAGARVSVDPNVRPESTNARALLDVLPLAHVLLPTEGELEALGADVDALVAGGATVCTTRGPAGALVRDGTGTTAVPAVPVEPVDTDGAGDSFAAGFIAASLAGADPRTAARAGVAVAAQAIRVTGPMTVVPSLPALR
ncbi:PfkB family carbohydrate kinase [Phytohabitans sp. ZYX-F-186]|uniref:PfkB family carbohydrate kinase n=1 Tax=Phytohabitans maris TaxID=3071409 RepID=A0ABU0ZJ75_9ACTN|nr:PfkB family carbohydrate kinase [Phytohabitans sp. ZYX-F-186]MDQ7906335.1 PfkB family carbohydrate kinase [Phytohabitans sp. ZYX-F-186]